MNKTIFKYKGKTVSKLNYRRHNLHPIIEGLMAKGIYCRIDRVCEYEFDTYVYLTIAQSAKQQSNVLDIAEQFDAIMKARRARLPEFNSSAS